MYILSILATSDSTGHTASGYRVMSVDCDNGATNGVKLTRQFAGRRSK